MPLPVLFAFSKGYLRWGQYVQISNKKSDKIYRTPNRAIDKKRGGDTKYILYPFGEYGKLVKGILNVHFGIQEHCIIDNNLSLHFDNVKNLDDLSKMDLSDVKILVTSDRTDIWDEIRSPLYAIVSHEQCVEMLPLLPLIKEREFPPLVQSRSVEYWLCKAVAESVGCFVMENMSKVKAYRTRYDLIEKCLYDYKIIEGMVLEFGVFKGESINFISSLLAERTVYGFDSFEGLPEDWHAGGEKGTFDLHGNMPTVNSNVQLIKGWFDKTLRFFLNDHEEVCSFIHIDCDIYSSTKTVLSALRSRIVPGTVILFDDYFAGPEWKLHEHKAFIEFVHENNIVYKYLGYANENTDGGYYIGSQVAVVIEKIDCIDA